MAVMMMMMFWAVTLYQYAGEHIASVVSACYRLLFRFSAVMLFGSEGRS
jgi:hypothetical protein